jgi:hypothetical protein
MKRALFYCWVVVFVVEASVLAQVITNGVPLSIVAPDESASETKLKEGRIKAIFLINSAQVDLEKGRVDEAEKKLRGALEYDPGNRAARYYLTLIRERRAVHQTAKLEPVYPIIRKQDGSLRYGVPVHQRVMREMADDLKRE